MLFPIERDERIIWSVSLYFSSWGNVLVNSEIHLLIFLACFQTSKSVKDAIVKLLIDCQLDKLMDYSKVNTLTGIVTHFINLINHSPLNKPSQILPAGLMA